MDASSPPALSPLAPADLSEWLAGPALIALRGGDEPGSEYRLGSREYDWHRHARGQVFCVESGFLDVRTPHGAWLLPPHRAGWMPPGVPHQVQVSGALAGWSLLVAPGPARRLPCEPCVIGVSDVLRALVRRAEDWDKQASLSREQARIAAVILDEIRRAPHEPLHLPMPSDARLRRVTQALMENPGDPRTLEAWAAWGAMSASTLRRRFAAETGLSFAQWRQQAQLARALAMLARGERVAQVADALGYASPSNFIAMFRRAFGEAPARFFAARRA